MANLPLLEFTTHCQRVRRLYKKGLRNLEAFYDRRHCYRYQAVLLRDRFDKNRCVDPNTAEKLVQEGEDELFQIQHPVTRKFPTSVGGVAHAREVEPPDWVMDYWHPLEKAQYPEYFKRREQRKLDYIKFWQSQYGNEPDNKGSH
ncbi:NADH dehydrogenase 1 beta subcomplex subunit 9 [Eumeta japonica]|uniref:NADH dehydrogenase [ubiquinone] 1 beta subcomplex subunit 9 n=1 Tax=Eumeta variegata TaxID=151549 RepID=A0A4C1XKD3_EUMVA|nr:NADH dehydrogenase 1 beta subcomplex subunit 9 [Eumeta japonica]